MDTIDDIGRRAAATVHAEADAVADVDEMLESLAAAVANSPGRGRRVRAESPSVRPRRWAVIGAAAAVLVAIAVGIVVVAGRDPHRRVVPAPSVPPSPVPTSPVDTEPPPPTASSTASPDTSSSTTSEPASTIAPSTGDGHAVSYKNPPPFLEPASLTTLEVAVGEDVRSGGIAVMESGVVVLDDDQAHVVGWDGTTRTIDVSAARESNYLGALVAGPGQVLYAIASGNNTTNMTAAEVWAIPLAGDRAGEAVASAPTDMNVIVERPVASFGHGSSNVVDRIGRIDGVVAPYVDENGEPWPEPLTIPEYRTDGDTVSSLDGSQSWPLQIERAPGSSDTYNGPSPPTPAPGGGAVWWDWIGPRSSNGDYALGTMPVIAFLGADGSVVWRRVPDGWQVAASDAWGTVLARQTGTTLELALATPTIAATPAPTPAQQAATDYLTALAARDYDAAAALLGNGEQRIELRADLAPIRDLLASGAGLAEALREWCEGDSRAACWMPTRIADTGAAASDAESDGIIVIADYDERDVGVQARYVVGTWEGKPAVVGLPPLDDPFGTARLRQLLAIDTLWILHPDDHLADGRRSAVVTTAEGPRNVNGPPDTAAVRLSPDGQTLWWSVGDGSTVVTDTSGTIVCTTTEPIVDVVGAPGAYRIVVERLDEPGPPEEPLPTPAFEVDCVTGAETPTDPRSWNGGPVTEQVLTAGSRSFTLRSTDHHGELRNDAGIVIGAEDSMVAAPLFSADGSVVIYGDNAGSANPNAVPRYVARDTDTGDLLWTYDSPTSLTGAYLSGDRVILTASIDNAAPALGTASVIALDLATGGVLMTVPTTFTVLGVR